MTGPKPKLNNGRIRLVYTTPEPLTHVCNLDVQIVLPLVGTVYAVQCVGGGTRLWHLAVDEFLGVFGPLQNAAGSFGAAVLEEYSAGIYMPLQSYTSAVVPTGGATYIAQQDTYTFRDSSYNLDKLVFLCTPQGPPARKVYAGLGVAEKALVDSVLAQTAGNVGYWYQSKDGNPISSFLAEVVTLNKKSRRRLGLV